MKFNPDTILSRRSKLAGKKASWASSFLRKMMLEYLSRRERFFACRWKLTWRAQCLEILVTRNAALRAVPGGDPATGTD
jgi:hypothetical protein